MVSMLSCFADSIKPQVLIISTSAMAGSCTIVCPDALKSPSMRSVSTLFLEQPSEITPILLIQSIPRVAAKYLFVLCARN